MRFDLWTFAPFGSVTMMSTSAGLSPHATMNCRTPVPTPQPSSMTPLQLSSFALKQSSGPVGVHAAVTTTPSDVTTFFATTLDPWRARGRDGPASRDERGDAGEREQCAHLGETMFEPPAEVFASFASGSDSVDAFGFISSKNA